MTTGMHGRPFETMKIVNHIGAQAAGTGDTIAPSARIDMQADGGWDGAIAVCRLGTITSGGVATFTMRHKSTDAAGDATTLTTSKTTGDSDEVMYLDCREPVERYIEFVVARTVANVEIDSVIVLLYRGRGTFPVSQPTGVDGAAAVRPATA